MKPITAYPLTSTPMACLPSRELPSGTVKWSTYPTLEAALNARYDTGEPIFYGGAQFFYESLYWVDAWELEKFPELSIPKWYPWIVA